MFYKHLLTLALAIALPTVTRAQTADPVVKPLLSAWALKAAERVEWDPENEVVHRLTTLLTLRRFGEVPYWLLTGLAWYVEIERCKDVYCFPYRVEFVWATEHTAWPKELEKLFPKDRDEYLPRLVGWKRGTFEVDRGREAWGFARFVSEHPGAWSAILDELATLRRTDGVRHFEDGSWELVVGWEPSVEQQRTILARHLGEDFEERAIESFRGKAAAKAGAKSRRSKK